MAPKLIAELEELLSFFQSSESINHEQVAMFTDELGSIGSSRVQLMMLGGELAYGIAAMKLSELLEKAQSELHESQPPVQVKKIRGVA